MNANRTGSRAAGTIARHATLLTLAAALLPAADLAAQACRGVPLADGSLVVSGFAGFTEEADSRWGGEAAYGLSGPVTVVAGYTRTGYEGAVPDAATSFHARAAAGGTVTGARPGIRLALCAAVGARWERYGDLRVLSVPAGVPVGLELPLGGGWSGVVHVEPRAVYTRGDVEGHVSTALSPGVRGGATIERGRLFLAASHAWVRAEQGNRFTAVGVGIRLGGVW